MLVKSSNKEQCYRSDLTELVPATSPVSNYTCQGRAKLRVCCWNMVIPVAIHTAQRTHFTQ